MSRSLRRSRRAPKKISSEYQTGDIVEINRSGIPLRAILIELVTSAGTARNPRWLVEFDVPPYKEEVSEQMFVKVQGTGDDMGENGSGASAGGRDASPTLTTASDRSSKRSATGLSKKTATNHSKAIDGAAGGMEDHKLSHASTKAEDSDAGKSNSPGNGSNSNAGQKKKAVSFSNNAPSPTGGSDGSSSQQQNTAGRRQGRGNNHASSSQKSAASAKSKKMSAREARSRRRALMADPAGGPIHKGGATLSTVSTGTKRKISGAAAMAVRNKRRRAAAAAVAATPGSRHIADAMDGPVTKVKFLTGTLYIYKGRRRRVKFIRRV